MADIFLSYAREDLAWASRMATALTERGWSVFWDRGIPTGKSFDAVIERELELARCVIVLWSRNSIGSDWVKAEAGEGVRRGVLTPAWIEDVRIPLEFRRLQTARLIGWTPGRSHPEFDRFVNDVARTIGADPTPIVPEEEEVIPEPPVDVDIMDGSRDTLLARVVRGGRAQPSYLMALAVPIAFAVGHVFRLPVSDVGVSYLIVLATVGVAALAMVLGNRLFAAVVSAAVGTALVLKPWLVPLEGGGSTFSYDSETAMTVWVPGALLVLFTVGLVITSSGKRLRGDLRRLRPSGIAIALALVAGAAAYFYFSRPTWYDVYEAFRPSYASLRQQLKALPGTLDSEVPAGVIPEPGTVVLDGRERLQTIRGEDPSTTAHLFLYQHLSDPDSYGGDLERALDGDLLLHLRDTGPKPVLSESVLADFATGDPEGSLRRTLEAPFLVVVEPLATNRTGREEQNDLAGRFRLFLYHLKMNKLLATLNIDTPASTTDELKEAVYAALAGAVGAKILR